MYEQIGVTRTTVQRWRNGRNVPDPAHIHLLLKALPEQESGQLRSLLQADATVQFPQERLYPGEMLPDRIPQHVYEEVHRLSRDAPDRFWLLGGTILFYALAQLSFAASPGLEILVARCMPPHEDGKIRSLRAYAGRGTAPWRTDFHIKEYFLGAESLGGYAVMRRHSIIVPDGHNSHVIASIYCQEHERSCAAVPIMREGKLAGSLIVSCTAVDFFTDAKLTLLEKYADLIRLAFQEEDFYHASLIDLALMPHWKEQKKYFASFRERVNEDYRRAVSQGQSPQEVARCEERVRQALESELLRLASLSEEPV